MNQAAQDITSPITWTSDQALLLSWEARGSVVLTGEASTGKTTSAAMYLRNLLLDEKHQNDTFLVLLPQQTLAGPYLRHLDGLPYQISSRVQMKTMHGIARRMISLFWPLVSSQAGFLHPYQAPRFLNLDTSQYYIAKIVEPMISQGAFSTITLRRTLLYTQLLDNLNKSALVGFPCTEIGKKLSGAWVGESSQLNVYLDVQEAVNRFRELCLKENLIDLSLQIELFSRYIWNESIPRKYLTGMYQHLIYDNVEEDAPFAHDIVEEWLPSFSSAVFILDENAGYRSFLGADPVSAERFRLLADRSITYGTIPGFSVEIQKLKREFLISQETPTDAESLSLAELQNVLSLPHKPARYFPQLMDQTAESVAKLIEDGVSPGEIVILSPFVSDAMGMGISHRLEQRGIAAVVHRPTQPLADQPEIQTLLTLTQLSHPAWNINPSKLQVINSLVLSIEDLDLVRAHLLGSLYSESTGRLSPVEQLPPETARRIPGVLIKRYDRLFHWLMGVRADETLDCFLSRLFGEVLSQPSFGFHSKLEYGQSAARLIEAYGKFIAVVNPTKSAENDADAEFIRTVLGGMVSSQFVESWIYRDPGKVLITPTLVFLMQNQTVDYQFWLQAGASGWYARLDQPLTHPYVLSRNWIDGNQWSTNEEIDLSRKNLSIIAQGLLSRCRKRVYVGISTFDESGNEERGLLLNEIQKLYRKALRGGSPHG